MKQTLLLITGLVASFGLGFFINRMISKQPEVEAKLEQSTIITTKEKKDHLKLGAFSVSLNVKDLKASKQFYENLGFTAFAGGMEKNYLIMKNENALIGLFYKMFEGHILTFNPGWDENAQNIEKFEDVREIQKHLKTKNITLTAEADEKTSGPASIMLNDPDGNVIYIDQHR